MTEEIILKLGSLSDYITVFGYLGIFLFFITVDQLTFIPEEITLLSIGYLAANKIFNPFLAGIVSIIALATVDLAYFFIARSGNRLIKKLHNKINRPSFEKLKEKFKHNFPRTLLIICFIPRMRLFAPLIAGMIKIPVKRFLFYDVLGLILFTSLYVSIGYIFHKTLYMHLSELEMTRHGIFIGAMIVLFFFILLFFKRSRKAGGRRASAVFL